MCVGSDCLGRNVIWVLFVVLGDPVAARASNNIWHFWLVYIGRVLDFADDIETMWW